MPDSEADRQKKKRARRQRADTFLIFDPGKRCPTLCSRQSLRIGWSRARLTSSFANVTSA